MRSDSSFGDLTTDVGDDMTMDVHSEAESIFRMAKYGIAVCVLLGLAMLIGVATLAYVLLDHFGVLFVGVPV